MDDLGRSHEELKAYAAKLERSNRELQDFASVASHDLQEPLRKVQAFSDRLRSRCAATIDDQGRDYLDRVQNAAARMQTLINDLLTYCPGRDQGTAVRTHRSRLDHPRGRVRPGGPDRAGATGQRRGGRIADGGRRPAASPPAHAELDRQLTEVLPAGGAAGGQGLEQASAPMTLLRGGAYRPGRSARSWSRTTGSASTRSTPSGFSRSSSGSTAAPSTRERESAWPSAARSSNGTAGRSRHGARPGRGRRSWSRCRSANRKETIADGCETLKSISILIADDDADDRMMAKEALDECRLANQIDFVEDGVELLAYLRGQGRYAGSDQARGRA